MYRANAASVSVAEYAPGPLPAGGYRAYQVMRAQKEQYFDPPSLDGNDLLQGVPRSGKFQADKGQDFVYTAATAEKFPRTS
jgi:hypothetical protein